MIQSGEKPKVAFATTVYDRADVGGGTFVKYLRDSVEKSELDVTFFSDDIRRVTKRFERKIIIPTPLSHLPGGFLVRALFYNKQIRSVSQDTPFDVVWHNNVITATTDSKSHGVPIVGMINDYNNVDSRTPFATKRVFGTRRAVIRYGWRKVERKAALRSDLIVVNSKFMIDKIEREYGIDKSRMRLLYKAVNLNQFAFAPHRTFSTPVKILFVKQDYVRGGLLDLFRALADFPFDVEVTVIGPPESQHSSIRKAAASCERVRLNLLRPMSRHLIPAQFRTHDLLCIPSRSEALGVTFLEALASGLPAVGSTAGGIPEVLDSGSAGWLARPSDPANLRSILLELIRNRPLRESKVMQGHRHVQKFRPSSMIARFNEIATEAIALKNERVSCV